ncbi:MAG: type II toxin-antitoxin system RelE family toxin [Thermoplasmatota archaeon]
MRIRLRAEAAATIRSLPPSTKKRIRQALVELRGDPQGATGAQDIRKLSSKNVRAVVYRVRVEDWRVVYAIEAPEIQVARVFHRREGYGWMERLEW